jgi:predicted esterase
MNEHEISVSKTARYYTHGTLNEQTKHVWIVCHGYQQLAKYFIRNFNTLNDQHFIISPEGFHRFYLNGYSGRVGASWMTSEDRLNDIKDYVNYLDTVTSNVLSKTKHSPKINVLGFSQGGATVSRWVCQGKTKIDNLILWSTVFPPDLNFDVDSQILNNLNFEIIIGDNDEFLSEETITKHLEILKSKKIKFNLTRFKGEHKIYPQILTELANKL